MLAVTPIPYINDWECAISVCLGPPWLPLSPLTPLRSKEGLEPPRLSTAVLFIIEVTDITASIMFWWTLTEYNHYVNSMHVNLFQFAGHECYRLSATQHRYTSSRLWVLVQMTGFEPAASCSRSKRSTKLSHIWIWLLYEAELCTTPNELNLSRSNCTSKQFLHSAAFT